MENEGLFAEQFHSRHRRNNAYSDTNAQATLYLGWSFTTLTNDLANEIVDLSIINVRLGLCLQGSHRPEHNAMIICV